MPSQFNIHCTSLCIMFGMSWLDYQVKPLCVYKLLGFVMLVNFHTMQLCSVLSDYRCAVNGGESMVNRY